MTPRSCRLAILAIVSGVAFAVVGPVAAEGQGGATAPAVSTSPSFPVPAWAFPIPPARAGGAGARGAARPGGAGRAGGQGPGRAQDAGPVLHVPGSTVGYTAAQTRDSFNIADWHPDEHAPLPDVVRFGRRPDVRACGYCHLANGFGKPENAPLAGQPADYIIQQMRDYKNGLRIGSEPRIVGPSLMVNIAKAATDDEVAAAAAYFSSVKRKSWIRVVESDTVPQTRIAGSLYTPVEGGGTEPIGNRIMEVPEDYEHTELRDGGSPFIAYAPKGSIAKGEALVTTGGGGKTLVCRTCHGADLRGLGAVPSIAGRSPSYMGRQMYDFRNGVRTGPWAPLMTEVVTKLTDEDIVSIMAYLSSRTP